MGLDRRINPGTLRHATYPPGCSLAPKHRHFLHVVLLKTQKLASAASLYNASILSTSVTCCLARLSKPKAALPYLDKCASFRCFKTGQLSARSSISFVPFVLIFELDQSCTCSADLACAVNNPPHDPVAGTANHSFHLHAFNHD